MANNQRYVVLAKNGERPVVISSLSLEYNDYLMSGYVEITNGTQKQCKQYVDELEGD